ncbi:MAG: Peptide chain release factor 1 [Brockia lithotrophica]|uniref:Peptide chain release factor 1 n=1 Tax=Brockia lithotrophica TaxID=933949 RepID=A0A2T5GAY7_9BACL|nr:MAG: Peptide chain release factor 1 [Brockia lithotrophica]
MGQGVALAHFIVSALDRVSQQRTEEVEEMWEKVRELAARHEAVTRLLAEAAERRDFGALEALSREEAELAPIAERYRAYERLERAMQEAREILAGESDPELRQLAREELERLKEEREKVEGELRRLLLPRDPHDTKNVFLEIRAAAGGEEAALFAADLLRMYSRYAERRGWTAEVLDVHSTDLGGVREAVLQIRGKGAYRRLKYESGTHRVQRVPETEAGGRIHTSTATVAVLPEVEDVEVEIDEKDLRIDVFSAGGPGGQHVNKTMSAVRIVHLPTGITVSVQDERSQHRNREKAMKILRARLFDYYARQRDAELSETRRQAVGTGDRSERIRTYNFPQNRVTDHRIGLTLYRLEEVLDGDLDELLDALEAHHEAEALLREGKG